MKKDGKPTGLQDAGSYFHTDYSYLQVPARATTLYSIVVPKVGGDTLFANQQAAYDDLPEAMKKRIEPLYGIHHYGNRHDTDEQSRTAASPLTDEQKAKMPLITHKIARPHPVTGRKSLYAVNGSSFGIVGMPDDEALDLLDELAAHSTQPKYRFSLKYGVGDVVVWDNASLLHSATLIDPDDARTLWRITVLEPAPVGMAPAGDRADLRARRNVALAMPRALISPELLPCASCCSACSRARRFTRISHLGDALRPRRTSKALQARHRRQRRAHVLLAAPRAGSHAIRRRKRAAVRSTLAAAVQCHRATRRSSRTSLRPPIT